MRVLLVLVLLVAPAAALHAEDEAPKTHDGKTLEAWVELTASDDADARVQAVKALAAFDGAAVKTLRQLLHHAHGGTRGAAARALGEIGPPAKAAIPDLIKQGQDADPSVRKAVMVSLGEFGADAEPAAPLLFASLEDVSEDVGQAAARSLGPLGQHVASVVPDLIDIIRFTADDYHFALQALARVGPGATKEMAVALKKGAPRTRLRLLRVAYEMGKDARGLLATMIRLRQTAEGDLLELLDMACGATGANITMAIEILLTELQDGTDEQSVGAATQLGGLRPVHKDTIKALVNALNNSRPVVRLAVVEALGNLGGEAHAAVEALAPRLADKDEDVRKATRLSIAAIGKEAPSLVIDLVPLLKDDGPGADLISQLLAEIGPPAVPHLIKALEGAPALAQARIAVALGGAGPRADEAAPPLLGLLASKDERVGAAAEKALGRLGGAAVGGLVKAMTKGKNPLPARALRALQGIGPDAVPAVPALKKFLKNKDPLLRKVAVTVLGEIGHGAAAAIKDVRKNLKHRLASVRKASAVALGHIVQDDKGAATALGKMLRDVDIPVRYAAISALGEIGAPAAPALRDLVKALRSGSPAVRKRIIDALGEIGPQTKDVLPALAQTLRDRAAVIRRASAEALGKFGAAGKPALADLEALRSDSDDTVREAAEAAILAITEPE